jgi:UV DNA damage endonuclease
MKIGYPCLNRTIGCKADRTFRLKSYSEVRLIETVHNNLDCLLEILKFNIEHDILFFRITSDLVPFASHPVCRFDWKSHFQEQLTHIGTFISAHHIRISMHPGQYTVLNTTAEPVLANSIKELEYHAQVLDSMDLDAPAKIQLHIGGVYGDKRESMARFITRYTDLDAPVRDRLVIENDDRNYTAADCLAIHEKTGIPVLFDVLHHELNPSAEVLPDIFKHIAATWKEKDGLPMVDYSHHLKGTPGTGHDESIDLDHFRRFLLDTQPVDFDVMLEIKDKEASALRAVKAAINDTRFHRTIQSNE